MFSCLEKKRVSLYSFFRSTGVYVIDHRKFTETKETISKPDFNPIHPELVYVFFKSPVALRNFRSNFSRNAVARQVAGEFLSETLLVMQAALYRYLRDSCCHTRQGAHIV